MKLNSCKFIDAKVYVVRMCIYFKQAARQFSLFIQRSVLLEKTDIKGVFDTYNMFPF